jgi:hypothetical protein
MVYSFARIGAALSMKVQGVFTQNRPLWVQLREKGGKSGKTLGGIDAILHRKDTGFGAEQRAKLPGGGFKLPQFCAKQNDVDRANARDSCRSRGLG